MIGTVEGHRGPCFCNIGYNSTIECEFYGKVAVISIIFEIGCLLHLFALYFV